VKARGLRFDLPHPTAGTVPQIASPMRFSATDLRFETPPPTLGQHTEAILQELGLTADAIARLRAEEVI